MHGDKISTWFQLNYTVSWEALEALFHHVVYRKGSVKLKSEFNFEGRREVMVHLENRQR